MQKKPVNRDFFGDSLWFCPWQGMCLLSGRSRVRIAPGVPNKRAILRWLFCLPRQQMRTRREIPETSKIRALGDEFLLVGGIPLGNRAGCATSSRTTLSSRRFFIKNHLSPVPSLLLSAKGHACCGYALVNAGITPPLRYQPFAACACGAACITISFLFAVKCGRIIVQSA